VLSFTFYDFPAAHGKHLRTTNPIESTFATVRHRTRQTKGCGSREATLSLVYKLSREAEKCWRRLDGYKRVVKVLAGTRYVDGEERSEKDDAQNPVGVEFPPVLSEEREPDSERGGSASGVSFASVWTEPECWLSSSERPLDVLTGYALNRLREENASRPR
jgi:hypothetical protein